MVARDALGHTAGWDTRRDIFEGGQWFRGQLVPEACDVSPNGKLSLYLPENAVLAMLLRDMARCGPRSAALLI